MNTIVVKHFGPDPTSVGGMASVIRVLREHQVGADVVDSCPTWTPRAPLKTARLFFAAARTILTMPSGQIVHVHLSEGGSFLREGSLVALANKRGIVTVVTLHGASFIPFECAHPHLVAWVLRRAQLVTCLDHATRDVTRHSAPRVPCEIVPNPAFIDISSLPADRTDELVVFAGEISIRKGADVLYRGWQLVAQRRPQARCLMVGPIGDFVPPSTERLEVLGSVESTEIKEILRRARVVALPSRAEGMPMILTEAMSLGRPFVSTPVGGIPELANDGGMLVPVGDEIALADRLTELLADQDLARTVGERGRRFCLSTRSTEVIDARLRELYTSATGT